MTEVTTAAIYNVSVETGDSERSIDQLTAAFGPLIDAMDKSTTSEETRERATRSSTDAMDRMLARYDPQIRAAQELQRVQDQLTKNYEDEAASGKLTVASGAERTQVYRSAAESLGLVTKATTDNIAVTNSWRNLWGLLPGSIGGATAASNANALAMRGLAAEHLATSEATRGFRDVVHTLDPILLSSGLNLGAMGSFAMAARAGIVALGVAIVGSLVLALENAADRARTLTTNLAAMLGGNQNGSAAFAAISGAADQARVPISALTASYEKLLLAQQKTASESGTVFAPGALAEVTRAADVIRTLSNAITIGGGTSKEVLSLTDTLIQGIGKDGRLTSQTFDQISTQSRTLGKAIMDAFGQGGSSIAQFEKFLDAGGGTLQRFNSGMIGISASMQKQRDDYVPTLVQAYDSLTTSVGKLLAAFGDAVGIGGVINSLAESVNNAASGWEHFDEVVRRNGGYLETMKLAFRDLLSNLGETSKEQQNLKKIIDEQAFSWSDLAAAIGGFVSKSLSTLGSWATSAISYLSSVAQSMRNLPSIPAGGGPPQTGPYSIPTAGGLGGYGNQFQSPGGGAIDYGSVSTDYAQSAGITDITGGYASGIDTVIPPGFPNDSKRIEMNVSSGERLLVVPAGQTLSDFIGGSKPINLGRFASGLDATIGPGGGSMPMPDAAATDQGHTLLDLGVSYQDLLGKLGVTLDDWRQTITGAGNDRVQDVIRQGNIQIITSEAMSARSIVTAINLEAGGIIGALGTLSSAQSAASSASNAASSASSVAAAASGSTAGYSVQGGIPDFSSDYNNSLNKLSSALGGGGGGLGGNVATAAARTIMSLYEHDQGKTTAPRFSEQTVTGNPTSQLPGSSSSINASISSTVGRPDVSAGDYSPIVGGDYGSYISPDVTAGYVTGGRFTVGGDGGIDTTPVKFNATRGEIVTIAPQGQDQTWSPGNGQSAAVKNITVNLGGVMFQVADLKNLGMSPQQIADQTRRAVEIAIKSA